jgi:hypothetical protein
MDRFTWGVVLAVLALACGAFGMVVMSRATEPPPDLATPDGTVRAYIAAIQDRRADEAWALLDGPEAIRPTYARDSQRLTDAEFRREVNNTHRPSNRRIRIAEVRPSGPTANVDIEIVTGSNGSFFFDGGSHSRRVAFTLKQAGGGWRITAAPSVWDIG